MLLIPSYSTWMSLCCHVERRRQHSRVQQCRGVTLGADVAQSNHWRGWAPHGFYCERQTKDVSTGLCSHSKKCGGGKTRLARSRWRTAWRPIVFATVVVGAPSYTGSTSPFVPMFERGQTSVVHLHTSFTTTKLQFQDCARRIALRELFPFCAVRFLRNFHNAEALSNISVVALLLNKSEHVCHFLLRLR